MQLGPTNLYKCPFCGKEKKLLSLISGNTFGAVVWSDTFRDYPMLPEPSRVQHCPECEKYFFLDDIQPTVLKDEMWKEFRIGCSETGSLDYMESREAMNQFAGYTLAEDQEEWLHLNLLYSFNDWRTRELMVVRKNLKGLKGKDGGWAEGWRESAQKQETECLARTMSDEDRALFHRNAQWLKARFPENRLLHAELHREMGEFEECLAILDEIGDNHLTRQFRAKALAGDTEVFILHLKDKEN